MPVFGVVSERAHGHVVTAVLIAMLAMLFTAISYGRHGPRLSQRRISIHLCRTGNTSRSWLRERWGMVMDYLLNPLICTIRQFHALDNRRS